MERAQRSEDGDTLTIVIAVDEAGRWVGLAGGYRPGDRGADAELISMWVAPDCRGHKIGPELVRTDFRGLGAQPLARCLAHPLRSQCPVPDGQDEGTADRGRQGLGPVLVDGRAGVEQPQGAQCPLLGLRVAVVKQEPQRLLGVAGGVYAEPVKVQLPRPATFARFRGRP